MDQIDFGTLRKDMVARMAARNIQDTRLLETLNLTPRKASYLWNFCPLPMMTLHCRLVKTGLLHIHG